MLNICLEIKHSFESIEMLSLTFVLGRNGNLT